MYISIQEAIQTLNDGGVVAIPTETVYGLAARIDKPQSVSNIFKIKGRPSNNPLIVHLAEVSQIYDYTKELPAHFESLVAAFWPGPMTLVLPIDSKTISSTIRAGLPTAAFRIPNHSLTLELIKKTGPLVMPSANLSGKPSSTNPEHVESDFGAQFPVLDGGRSHNGVESTILMHNNNQWEIIRLGALEAEAFTSILGYTPSIASNKKLEAPVCPGQLYRHYAPKAKLILTKSFVQVDPSVVVGFNDRKYPENCRLIPFGSQTDSLQAATNLYSILRQLDQEGIEVAYVDIDFPLHGLWITLLERLTKAAQK